MHWCECVQNTTTNGTVLLFHPPIHAYDGDVGIDESVVYSLVQGARVCTRIQAHIPFVGNDTFMINSTTGELHALVPILHDAQVVIQVTI